MPSGWTTYAYSGIRISAPKNWVMTQIACQPESDYGTLVLGGQATEAVSCPKGPPNMVSVVPISRGSSQVPDVPESTENVNGLHVLVMPQPPGQIFWKIPNLSIWIEGSGPLAMQVMNTLHRFPHSSSNPTPVVEG